MAVDDEECTVGLHFAKESLKELHEMLSVENALKAGCRVKKHPGACVLCVANNDCSRLPIHVHCFPADTEVSAGKIIRAYRRWYTGDLVWVEAADRVLSGTPNHPVLTDRGWVALGELNDSDRLVNNPNEQDASASIGDVFNALMEACSPERMPARRDQFHGDGHGDVDVVTVDPCVSTEPVALPDGVDNLPGTVLGRVVKVWRAPFEGYVYNLETASGWYLANSLTVSNCRCRPEPFLSSMDE